MPMPVITTRRSAVLFATLDDMELEIVLHLTPTFPGDCDQKRRPQRFVTANSRGDTHFHPESAPWQRLSATKSRTATRTSARAPLIASLSLAKSSSAIQRQP